MRTTTFFLDVNVPMYAAGAHHPYKAACTWLMQEVAAGRLIVAMDTEIIQEVLHRYGSIQKWETGITMALDLLDLVPRLYPVGAQDIKRAIELFRRFTPAGVKARDTLHAAVMQTNGLTYILSTDQHFDRIEGITRVNVGALETTRLDVERIIRQAT